MTRSRAPLGSVAAAVMLIVSFACRGGESPQARAQAQAAAPAGPPTIEAVRVVQKPIDVTLDIPGELEPFESVAIFSKVTGFVRSIGVDRGSRVRAGDVLAVLDAPELAAQRAEAQSKLQAAESQLGAARAKADGDAGTYERLQAAAATPGVVAGNDVVLAQKAAETSRSQVAAAEQNAAAARQALQAVAELQRYLRVTAPFNGVVTERNVHPGALVGPNSGAAAGTPMLRIVQSERLRLVVPVPETYIAGVAEGTTVMFSVPAYPGERFTGKIARVAQAVDVKTRTMAVELDVANADRRLSPGSFAQVRWTVHRSTPSLLVPSTTIATTTGRTFVVRVRNNRAEWVDVKTGLGSGALVEVFGDLRAGDIVAARGTDEIRSGTEVRTKGP